MQWDFFCKIYAFSGIGSKEGEVNALLVGVSLILKDYNYLHNVLRGDI